MQNKKGSHVQNKLHIKLSAMFLLLLFSSCQTNGRWLGTFEGTATESSQINRLQNGETKYFTGGRSHTNYRIRLTQENRIVFIAISDTCRLRLDMDDSTHARITQGQTCNISINGYEGKANMVGQVYFEGGGQLMIQIVGTAAEPNTGGGYAFDFQGKKAD